MGSIPTPRSLVVWVDWIFRLILIYFLQFTCSILAQRKRVGPITQRSFDRNEQMLLIPNRLVVMIPASHAGSPGSIPGLGMRSYSQAVTTWDSDLIIKYESQIILPKPGFNSQ